MATRLLVVAAEKWNSSSGVGSRQMMEESKVESPAAKRRLYVCCSTVIFGVCTYSETVIVPVLKSVTRT
jgi:hypothetical protein